MIAGPAERSGGGGTTATADVACVICLDEEVADGDAMLTDMCACKTTGMHQSCCARLLNSRRRRKLAMAERTACPVCSELLQLPFEFTTIADPDAAGGDNVAGAGRSRFGTMRSIGSCMAIAFGLAFGVRLLTELLDSQVAFLVMMLLVISYLIVVVYSRKRSEAAQPRADEEDAVDDDDEFFQIVDLHRRSIEQHRLPIDALASTPSQCVIVHIGVGERSVPAGPRAPAAGVASAGASARSARSAAAGAALEAVVVARGAGAGRAAALAGAPSRPVRGAPRPEDSGRSWWWR